MNQVKKASLLMILSAFFFSIMQIAVKFTASTVPVSELVFMRNFVMLLAAGFVAIKNKKPLYKDKKNLPLILGRGIFGMFGVYLYFIGTKYLPSAEASVLQKSSPFFVFIFSYFAMKEPITRLDMIALIIAFAGVLFITKPSASGFNKYAVLALLSGVFAAAAYTCIGMLKGKEESHTIMLSFAIVTCLCMLPLMIRDFKVPNTKEILGLIVIGICGMLGQYFLTYAYMYAPAGRVSIFNYTSVLFTSIIGYFAFGDIIDLYSGIGIILIFIGAYIAYINKNRDLEKE